MTLPIADILANRQTAAPSLATRNAKEDIINQIVARTRGSLIEKKELAKLIALWANRYRLDATDLHALLAKADDPTIRSYTGFVRWSIKDAPKPSIPETSACV